MALNGGLGLGMTMSLQDLATGPLEKLSANFMKFDRVTDESLTKFTRLSGLMKTGMLAIGGAAVAAGAAAFGLAVRAQRFDQAMADAGIRMGASVEQMGALRAAALSTDAVMAGFSADQTALTLKAMAEEGYGAEASMQALMPTLHLARITGQDAAQTAGFLTDALSVFGLQARDAELATDKMVFAMQRFGITNKELAPLVSSVGAAAKLAGANLDDTLLTLGLIVQGSSDVGQAGMAARMAFMQMADENVRKKLSGVGISVTDASKRMRSMAAILTDLTGKTAKMTDAQRSQTIASIFGNRAAGGMNIVMEQLANGVEDGTGKILKGAAATKFLMEQMGGAGGMSKRMAEALQMSTLGGQMQAFGASVSTTLTQLGSLIAPVFRPLVETALLAAEAFRAIFPKTVPGLDGWVKQFEGVKLLFKGLIQLFTSGEMSGAVADDMLKAKNAGIMRFAIDVFLWVNRIKNFLSNMVDGFRDNMENLRPTFEILKAALGELGNVFGIVTGTADENRDAFGRAGAEGRSLGESISSGLNTAMRAATVAITFATAAVELLKTAWSALGPVVMAAGGILVGTMQAIYGVLTDDGSTAWKGFFDAAYTTITVIVDIMYWMIKAFTKSIDQIGRMIPGVGELGLTAAVEREQADVHATLGRLKTEGLNMAGINAPPVPGSQMIRTREGFGVPEFLARPDLGRVPNQFTPLVGSGASPPPASVGSHTLESTAAATRALLEQQNHILKTLAERQGGRDQTINVGTHIDGQKVAEAVARARADEAARSFSPVGGF